MAAKNKSIAPVPQPEESGWFRMNEGTTPSLESGGRDELNLAEFPIAALSDRVYVRSCVVEGVLALVQWPAELSFAECPETLLLDCGCATTRAAPVGSSSAYGLGKQVSTFVLEASEAD